MPADKEDRGTTGLWRIRVPPAPASWGFLKNSTGSLRHLPSCLIFQRRGGLSSLTGRNNSSAVKMKGLYTSCLHPWGSGGQLGMRRRADTHKPGSPPTPDLWVHSPPEGACYARNGQGEHLDGQEDIKLLGGILTVLHFSHKLPRNHSSLSEPAVRCYLTMLGCVYLSTSSLWSVFAGSSVNEGPCYLKKRKNQHQSRG